MAFIVIASLTSAQTINAPCTFTTTANGYTCQFRSVYLAENETLNIVTNHDGDLTDADVLQVDFYSSRMNYLPNQMFSRFPNLRHLRMNAAYMQTIRNDSFDGASSLIEFTAVFNAISSLPANVFRGAANLEEITLVFNNIVFIDETAFNGLSRLSWLNLDQNQIESLAPQTLTSLVNLQFLSLSNNIIHRLPANLFTTLSSLSNMLLLNNEIEDVHLNAFNGLTNLDSIDLSRNNLTRIDARLFNPTRILRVLHLNQNAITAIHPDLINNLQNLERLNLIGNQCIDEEFENVSANRPDVVRSLERCFAGFGRVRTFHMVLSGTLELTEL